YIAATFELTFFAMLFAVVVGVNTGIISAWKQNSLFDLLAMLVALLGVSMSVFWFALMEQWIFAQELSWLTAHGSYDPRNPSESINHFYVLDSLLNLDFVQAGAVLLYLILP